MTSWIITIALYALGMGLLLWLGGVAAASDAISRWGRSTADPCAGTSCS